MPRGRKGDRALGPYKQGRKWRIWEVRGDGARTFVDFEIEADAIGYRDDFNNAAHNRTIEVAIERFLEHIAKFGAGNRGKPMRPKSLKTAGHRIRGILLGKGDGGALLITLTEKRANQLYQLRIKDTEPDTHRSELYLANSFGDWCVNQGWLPSNPFEKVRPEGSLSTGKPQLTFDEAEVFLRAALADKHTAGLAAAVALMMGLRVGEIVGRKVRDLDADGTVLRITEAKTSAGVRVLTIPAILRPRLRALAEGKDRDALLFPFSDQRVRGYTVRLCKQLGFTRVTPHGLRGTMATRVLTMDGSFDGLRAYVGHSDHGQTLKRHYLQPGSEHNVAISRYEEMVGNPTTTPTAGNGSGNETGGIVTSPPELSPEVN